MLVNFNCQITMTHHLGGKVPPPKNVVQGALTHRQSFGLIQLYALL